MILFLVSKPFKYSLVRKSFSLSTMNNIKENMYWHTIGKILSSLNSFPYEDLGPTQNITSPPFLYFKYLMHICWISPENYSILKYWMQVGKVHHKQNIRLYIVN